MFAKPRMRRRGTSTKPLGPESGHTHARRLSNDARIASRPGCPPVPVAGTPAGSSPPCLRPRASRAHAPRDSHAPDDRLSAEDIRPHADAIEQFRFVAHVLLLTRPERSDSSCSSPDQPASTRQRRSQHPSFMFQHSPNLLPVDAREPFDELSIVAPSARSSKRAYSGTLVPVNAQAPLSSPALRFTAGHVSQYIRSRIRDILQRATVLHSLLQRRPL